MVIDLLTQPRNHQFGPRVTFFSLLTIPFNFNMTHDHVQKTYALNPQYPPSTTLGYDPGARMKITPKYFSFMRRHTTFGLKIFEIDSVIEIIDI